MFKAIPAFAALLVSSVLLVPTVTQAAESHSIRTIAVTAE